MNIDDIPFDDPKTYQLLSEGKTLGIFQLESPGMVGLLRQVRPSSLNDISAVLALYRPGPVDSGSHTEYARRKSRKETGVHVHPELDVALEPILRETYGLIVYQEQVLEIINKVTGWGYAESEDIFTAMRKKKLDKMEASKPSFFRDASAQGYSEGAIQALWDVLVPFSDYSFNKAHSIGYAYLAYRGTYLKANYPKQYMASLLSSAKDQAEVGKFALEAERLNLELLPPDINKSGPEFRCEGQGIRYGLAAIRGVGRAAAEAIVSRRPYGSIDELFRRADHKVLNAKVLEALGQSGALDSLWSSREELVGQAHELARLALEDRRHAASGQHKILRVRYRPTRQKEGSPQKDTNLRAEWERATLGTTFTQPSVLISLTRPLSPSEWVWAYRLLTSQPGRQPVRIIIRGIAIKVPIKTVMTEELKSHLSRVGMNIS